MVTRSPKFRYFFGRVEGKFFSRGKKMKTNSMCVTVGRVVQIRGEDPNQTPTMDPRKCFSDGPDFVVTDSFKIHVLPALKPVGPDDIGSPVKIAVAKPERRLDDRDILAELKTDFLLEWHHFVRLRQSKSSGESDVFISIGENFCYMRGVQDVVVVFLFFNLDSRKWELWGLPLKENENAQYGRYSMRDQLLAPAGAFTH